LPRQIFLGKTILGKKISAKKKKLLFIISATVECKYKPNGSLLLHKKKAFHLIQNDLVDESFEKMALFYTTP
jgi:hypothetical protein